MKSDTAILTIAIPTYNRAPKLRVQIDRLLPQLRPGVRLQIFDNGSSDTTRELVESYGNCGVEYAPAKYNGGSGWNFSRCISESQSEWVWVLSDDDPASSTAVTDLLKVLHHQSCDFIHASTPGGSYASDIVVSDLPSLFQHTRFHLLLWISTGIYRTSSFLPLLDFLNDCISTWSPQVMVVLRLLEAQKGKVLLSPVDLFGEPGGVPSWSPLELLIRISLAPEHLADPAHQQLLAQDLFISNYASMMLQGIKETTQVGGLRKWRRIRRQAAINLKSYYRGGVLKYIAGNWFMAGHRKKVLQLFYRLAILQLLGFCPDFAFHRLAKTLPLSKTFMGGSPEEGQ